MSIDRVGVHASHCCERHGCKYGDPDCPVETGQVKALYECEECGWEKEEYRQDPFFQELNKMVRGWQLKTLSADTEMHNQKIVLDKCGRQIEELMRKYGSWYES